MPAAAIGARDSIRADLQWKQREPSLAEYAGSASSSVSTSVKDRSHSAASRRQSARSSGASDGETAVTHRTDRGPSVSVATQARKAKTAPPLKATTMGPTR